KPPCAEKEKDGDTMIKLVQANKWAAHPSQDPSSTWLLTWLRFIQSTENHDGPALQVDSGPPARPQPAPPHPAQDPSPPPPRVAPHLAPQVQLPLDLTLLLLLAPPSGWSATPPPGSHLGPPAGPAPEPKWKKNLRLLMKRRDQAGSRGSRRGAVDEAGPAPEPKWKKNLRLLMKRRDQAGSRGSRRGAVDEGKPSPPVPEEGWSLVPCAHPTRIVLRRPQRSGSSPRPEPPREPLPVRKVPDQQWMKSARLLMKKRSQVGSRWRKRGAEAAGMSAGNGAAKRFCPST
ncbi:hypothetical protein KUCAC02_035185, partial [Chaenocephalus aceratus]